MTEQVKPMRFRTERTRTGYVPEKGSFEAVLLGIRESLPEEVHSVDEGDVFEKVDEKAAQMTLDQACFQYFMAGKGHITLAEMVIDSFPQMRSGAASNRTKERIVSDLAKELYKHYPEAYKAQVKE